MERVGFLTKRFEADGFEDLWIPDERFQRDVYVTLAVAAAHSTRLWLSTCVTDPYIRHPMLTATAIATLDELSQGRVRVAMGAGLSGFAALGIDRNRPATAIREAVTIMRRAWTGEPVSFRGHVLSCNKARIDFPSRQDIQIYVAGRGPAILRTAGEVADGVIIGTFSSRRALEAALLRVDEGLTRSRRVRSTLDVVSWLYISISSDSELARRAVRRPVAVALWGSRPVLEDIGVEVPGRLEDVISRSTYSLGGAALEEAAELVPLELTQDLAVAGTPAEVTAQLSDVLASGVNGVAAWLHPAPGTTFDETLDLFTDVIGDLRHQ